MNRVMKKISLIGISLICILQNACFATSGTIADGMLRQSRTMMKETETTKSNNYLPIIIGITIAVIIVVAVIIILKNRNKKENKSEE